MQMSGYFAVNPQIVVNGFVKAGITAALDGQEDQQEQLHEIQDDSEDDFAFISYFCNIITSFHLIKFYTCQYLNSNYIAISSIIS